MIALYFVGILIAWCVGPRRRSGQTDESEATKLRLVIGAMVIDQARQPRRRVSSR